MCEFANLQLSGGNITTQGTPTTLTVYVRTDCPAVNIRVRRASSDPTPFLTVDDVQGDLSQFNTPPYLAEHQFDLLALGESVRCGERLHIIIECVNDTNCRLEQEAEVVCKDEPDPSGCPNAIVVQISPPVDQTADCMPAGNYSISVTDPVGNNISYYWYRQEVGSDTTESVGQNAPVFNFQRQAGDPATIYSVTVIPEGCPPLLHNVLFPETSDSNCPTGFTVSVLADGSPAVGPHDNTDGAHWQAQVPSGSITVRVSAPVGSGITYDWTDSTGTLVQTGASNEYTFTLAANQTTTIGYTISAGDCCPQMQGSVTISTDPAQDPPPPDDDGSDNTDETGNTDDTNNDDDNETTIDPPTIPPWVCPLLGVLLGIAIAVFLASVIATGCPVLLPTATVTIAVAAAAAVVFAVLLAALCQPTRCRWLGIIIWACKWAILCGVLIAIFCGSLDSAMWTVFLGGLTAALILAARSTGCTPPRLFSLP